MVRRTTQVLLDTSNGSAQTASALQPRLLLDLLDLLFEQFHTVATGHECVLTNMHAMVVSSLPTLAVILPCFVYSVLRRQYEKILTAICPIYFGIAQKM